jgi:hypothetical protein
VLSGLLNLSRNLGLVTGASVMAALFAMASAGLPDPAAAAAHGLQTTFRVAAGLGVLTMGIAAFAVAGLAKAGRVV